MHMGVSIYHLYRLHPSHIRHGARWIAPLVKTHVLGVDIGVPSQT
jgi:hypothetical protein